MDWIQIMSFSIISLFMTILLTYNVILSRQMRLLKKGLYVVIKQQEDLKQYTEH
ncbi:hypothetical protein [Bacillus sp. FJAT-47783]|uniref:hypothetical protein n=1 Tax=Bacillus sp. FJAT-47783 TaxID=2922712 RepID=UPI001FAC3842|nr:hypothetical protein [Bacillus sp. FJAT-47783]